MFERSKQESNEMATSTGCFEEQHIGVQAEDMLEMKGRGGGGLA